MTVETTTARTPADAGGAAPGEGKAAPPKILVVDDTPLNVKLLGDLLAVKGYDVATAQSGEDALAKLAVAVPDIVLLDVMMPGLSGYDVCRRIRANPATALLPVVMVTSLDPQQERIHGIEAGADDFLSKPINQPELFARVRSLLRIKTLQDEVRRQAEALQRCGSLVAPESSTLSPGGDAPWQERSDAAAGQRRRRSARPKPTATSSISTSPR